MEQENLIPENRRYNEKWKELVLLNRRVGRDYQVLCDYLCVRDEMLEEYKAKIESEKFNLYDKIFEELEERTKARVERHAAIYCR